MTMADPDRDLLFALLALRSSLITMDPTTSSINSTGTGWAGEPASFAEFAVRARRFHRMRLLARGGLGAVFVAHDNELNREVALKEILELHADDPSSQARFLLEAE